MRDIDGRRMDVDPFDASVRRHHRSSVLGSHARRSSRAPACRRWCPFRVATHQGGAVSPRAEV